MSVSVDLYKALRLARACSAEVRRPTTSVPGYRISVNVSRRLLELERIAFRRLGTYGPWPSSAVAESVLGQERPRARACPEHSVVVRRPM